MSARNALKALLILLSTAFAGAFLATALAGASMAQSISSSSVARVNSNSLDYQLGVNDHIKITVFGEPTLSGEFVIGSTGDLSLPLIGGVAASGMTVSQLTNNIQQKLADGYIRDPKVTIEVTTFRPYYILGEVTKPGEYPYQNGLTVLNAVATAQGFTYRADKRQVFIKHAGESSENRLPLTASVVVTPGDTIRVGERYF